MRRSRWRRRRRSGGQNHNTAVKRGRGTVFSAHQCTGALKVTFGSRTFRNLWLLMFLPPFPPGRQANSKRQFEGTHANTHIISPTQLCLCHLRRMYNFYHQLSVTVQTAKIQNIRVLKVRVDQCVTCMTFGGLNKL